MHKKIEKPGVFGAQFKILQNGSIVNYSPHTSWVWEDGKQPRVIRHNGLAFVLDPRVYAKCRPEALKDFVAYKYLPRAKPRVSVTMNKPIDVAGPKNPEQTSSKAQTTNVNPNGTKRKTITVPGKGKKKTSPKKPPPKNLEQILTQTSHHMVLRHEKLFSNADLRSKKRIKPVLPKQNKLIPEVQQRRVN